MQDQTIFRCDLTSATGESSTASKSRLLLEAADAIEDLGDVDVLDLILQEKFTSEGWVPAITVYFRRSEPVSRVHSQYDEVVPTNVKAGNEDGTQRDQSIEKLARDPTNYGFYLSDHGTCSVPGLLRGVADSVERLGKVDVHDLVMQFEATVEGRVPSAMVYYSRIE